MFFIRIWLVIKLFFLLLGLPVSWKKPFTKWQLLCSLVGKQVEVLTTFGFLSGKIKIVKRDYVVLIDDLNSEVFVKLNKIESVRSLLS